MKQNLIELAAPRFETGPELIIAGIREQYTADTSTGIPLQWQRFEPWIGSLPGQIGITTYGVISETGHDGLFDYYCGVEISDAAPVPADLTRLRIPPQHYAVFSHREHISRLRATFRTIFCQWLPDSGLKLVDSPVFERYGKEFEARTGNGGLEIWLPIVSPPIP
jgi:AraC family transcriptional regulator